MTIFWKKRRREQEKIPNHQKKIKRLTLMFSSSLSSRMLQQKRANILLIRCYLLTYTEKRKRIKKLLLFLKWYIYCGNVGFFVVYNYESKQRTTTTTKLWRYEDCDYRLLLLLQANENNPKNVRQGLIIWFYLTQKIMKHSLF